MDIKIDETIFRDYDIRGVYPKQINEEVYYILGRAVASYLSVSLIAVGFDMRLSSAVLFKAITKGLTDQGSDVVDLGLISTEMHYFASGKYRFPASIIISASHNPAQYNGLKIVTAGVVPLHGEYGLPKIKRLALAQQFKNPIKKGNIAKQTITKDWINHALSFIDTKKIAPLTVVIDAGNGMGGVSWSRIEKKLPIRIIPLYFEPDGHFPHHLPDPLKAENLASLKRTIIEKKADLGLAIDGDADRLFAVDEKGTPLSGTVTTAILAAAMLEKYHQGTILYNAVCGRIVPEKVLSLNGKAIRVRVGHSFIKTYMKKHQAIFAGEHSGHFYFKDNFYADSAFIAGLTFLEFLSKKNTSLSTLVSQYNKYPASGEVNFKTATTEDIHKQLPSFFADADSIDYLDGLSVWYNDWWFNLRASKTEPYIRLNVEADNSGILDSNLTKLTKIITSLGAEKV